MDVLTDRFDIEHEIGAGGMGTVFRARDREGGGVVALKVLRRGSTADSQRFDREAHVLADLTHPAIVGYVAHGITTAGDPYLAMEWLDGEDLSTRLQRGRLTAEETVRLGAHIGGALGAAHAHGVVHRDIKPSNLFLPGGDIDRVKLLDFGVARWSRPTQMPTMTGTVLGTPAYMSPEQARGDKRIGPEADVFSLGCVLFECLTGEAPFAGDNFMATLAKLILGEPPRITKFRSDVPPSITAAVERMMDRKASRRPPDGDAVRACLTALDTHGMPEPRGDGGSDAPRPSGKLKRAEDKPRSGVIASARATGRTQGAASSRRAPRESRASGFASAIREASRKPDAAGTLSEQVAFVLAKYIPMPWAMLKAQCQRLKKDPDQLVSADMAALADALVAAASPFTGPAERLAMRDELLRLDAERQQRGSGT